MTIKSLTAMLLNGLICVTTVHAADNIKEYSHIQATHWLSGKVTPFLKILHTDNAMQFWKTGFLK